MTTETMVTADIMGNASKSVRDALNATETNVDGLLKNTQATVNDALVASESAVNALLLPNNNNSKMGRRLGSPALDVPSMTQADIMHNASTAVQQALNATSEDVENVLLSLFRRYLL